MERTDHPSSQPSQRGPHALRMDRRRALLGIGGGAAALALAACGGEEEEGPDEDTEAGAMTTLIDLERRAAGTLASGARFSEGAESREFTRLERDSIAHVAALEDLIERSGGTPPPPPNVPVVAAFVRDADSARTASLVISNRLVDGYLDAIAQSTSPERRQGLTTLLANIAQRQVVLGGLRRSEATLAGDD
jgi:hypothetical protein